MTTSKHYGPRRDSRVGIIGGDSEGPLYWDVTTFFQNLEDARRRPWNDDVVALRQRMLDARKAMDYVQRETFRVDYLEGGPIVTDEVGRQFGTSVTVVDRPTSVIEHEARNYLVQEILDELKADRVPSFEWVDVRTPTPTPKPQVHVVDGQYNVALPGDLRFAIDVDKAHLLPQVHEAIEAYKAGEAGIVSRARGLFEEHAETSLPWEGLGQLEQAGWLYAARAGGR